MSQGNGDGAPFSIIRERTIPDAYSDSVAFDINVYGVTIEFGQRGQVPPGTRGKAPHIPHVRIHMSPQHAKVMAKLFVRNMRAYEEQVGPIQLPQALLKELKLEEEW